MPGKLWERFTAGLEWWLTQLVWLDPGSAAFWSPAAEAGDEIAGEPEAAERELRRQQVA